MHPKGSTTSASLKTMRTKSQASIRESASGRRQVVIPKQMAEKLDPDDVLTPEERAVISKARREMREGKYVTLAKFEHDLANRRPPRRRKTA
jgi:hypothetical protein